MSRAKKEVFHDYLSLPWIAERLNGEVVADAVHANILGCHTEVRLNQPHENDVIVTCVPVESQDAIEVEVRRILDRPKLVEPTPEERKELQKCVDSGNASEERLNAIVATIPGLKYDYDRASGVVAVPDLEKPVFTEVVLDPSAPDKIRVRSFRADSQQVVDDYVRVALGLPRIRQASANDNAAPISAPPSQNGDPLSLDAPGGLLTDVARFVYETSRKPIAEFSVLSAIALFSALFGRRVIAPDGTTLNLYEIIVAPPGGGKDRPLKAPEQIATAMGCGRLIGPNDFASDSAMERVLRTNPCQLLPLDEAGLFFSASGRFSQPWERAKRKALLELYSASKGRWVAKSRAQDMNKNGDEPIYWPTLSIIGATTPGNFYEGLHEEAFKDGLMARLIVVTCEQMPALQRIKGHPKVPAPLVASLKDAFMAVPLVAGNLAAVSVADPLKPPLYHTARWADAAAEDALYAIEQWASDISASKEKEGLIVNRAGEQTMKLATIRALSRDPGAPSVSAKDIEWGFGVVRRSHETIKRDAERFMSGSTFEALVKAIEDHARTAGPDGLKRSDLLRRGGVSQAPTRDIDAAIKRLDETGRMTSKITGTGQGRPGVRYTIVEKPDAG